MAFNGLNLLLETDLFFAQYNLEPLDSIPASTQEIHSNNPVSVEEPVPTQAVHSNNHVSTQEPVCELRIARRSHRTSVVPTGSPPVPRLEPVLELWTPRDTEQKRKCESKVRMFNVTNPDPQQKPVVLYRDYYFDVVFSDGMVSHPFIAAINGTYNGMSPNKQIVYVKAGPNAICDLQSNCGWQRGLLKNSFKVRLRKINLTDNETTSLELVTGRWVGGDFIFDNQWTIPVILHAKKRDYAVLKLI